MTAAAIIPIENRDQWLRARHRNINSTEVSTLFGANPYQSLYSLWHEKRSDEPEQRAENERMLIGRHVEAAIGTLVEAQTGLQLVRSGHYYERSTFRIGTSIDFMETSGKAIVEAKNVDSLVFAREWEETDFGVEAPLHIELQVQHQLLVTGFKNAKIAALVGGNRLILLDREADEYVHEVILNRVTKFWLSIESGTAPPPDYPADAQAVIRRLQYADPGKVYDGPMDRIAALAAQYKAASDAEAKAKADKETARAQIVEIIGDAERVIGSNYTISAGMVGPTTVPAYERNGYRNFRVTFKKEK